MINCDTWDWDIGKKEIADIDKWKEKFSYIEEFRVTLDGEKVAAIVKNDDMEFTICTQNQDNDPETWENSYDKVWNLKFGPDGRLSAFVSNTGEWTVSTDDTAWENSYDFIWDMQFSKNGDIAVSAQKELLYCVVNNDTPWENEFSRLTSMVLTPDGKKSAAVIESVPVLESEIFKFRQGCYSVAVNGQTWDKNFMNVWNPCFSSDSNHAAAAVRTSYYDYHIAVDGKIWDKSFSSVWEPCFAPSSISDNIIQNVSKNQNPSQNHIKPSSSNIFSVSAPVKKGGKWFLAKDGEIFWDTPYFQLWHHLYSPDGNKIAAIISPLFGEWTMAVDNTPWEITFSDYLSDPTFSSDSSRLAAVFKDKGRWGILADGRPWEILFDMAWTPVFSPDSSHLALKVEKDNFYYIALNGKIFSGKYDELNDPVFSSDSSKMLIRGRQGGKYFREVVSIN